MNKYKGKYQAVNGDINIWKRLKSIEARLAFGVGLALVIVILVWAILIPCPSQSQFQISRIVLSLGAASLAAALPEFFRLSHSGILKIGAGLMVFTVVYFFIPAGIMAKDNCHQEKHLKGRVLYSNVPLQGVEVIAPSQGEADKTNGVGDFNIPYEGELEMPLTLQLKYGTIDTTVSIEEVKEFIEIKLRDTIPVLSLSQASVLVQGYLDRQQEKLQAAHQAFMARHGGRKVNFEEICRIYKRHESFCNSERNGVSFENGFDQLSTQKAIREAHILIEPFNPYGAYYLDNYDTYLYQLDSAKEQSKRSCKMHFALLNLNKPTFRIESLTTLSRQAYLIRVSFKDNVRQVRTLADFESEQSKKMDPEFSRSGKDPRAIGSGPRYIKVSGGRKSQTTSYTGTRPYESFIIHYQRGHWQISGTK